MLATGHHAGRFAPSPTGPLHLGNLRTALVAWLFARAAGDRFVVRMEDLDQVNASPAHEAAQLADLAALGLDWDGPVLRQSDRFDRYRAAIAQLDERGLVYRCYCSRREIREAVGAPHGPAAEGRYPGTCRTLTAADRAAREAEGRRPALRLRTDGERIAFVDRLAGPVTGVVDDVVLCRNDGVPAYNLAVVLDDGAQGVREVVRGDDLLHATPSQLHLASLLGAVAPTYAHVPLVLGPDGARLAKRHGAVTLADRVSRGETVDDVRARLAVSLGLAEAGEAPTSAELVARLAARGDAVIPRAPWVLGP
jgi:glutamyl-tRNA synthetase